MPQVTSGENYHSPLLVTTCSGGTSMMVPHLDAKNDVFTVPRLMIKLISLESQGTIGSTPNSVPMVFIGIL